MYSYEEEYDPIGSDARDKSEPRRAAWQWALLAVIFFGSLSSYAYLDTSYVDEAVVEPAPVKTARTGPIKVRPTTKAIPPPSAKSPLPGSDYVVEYESEIGLETSRSDTVIGEAKIQNAPTARITQPNMEPATPRIKTPTVQQIQPNARVQHSQRTLPPAATRPAIEPITPPQTHVELGQTQLPPLQDALEFSMTPPVAPPPLISPPLPAPNVPLNLQIVPPSSTPAVEPSETSPTVAFTRELPQTVTVEILPSDPTPALPSIAPRAEQALETPLADSSQIQSPLPPSIAEAGQTPALEVSSEQAIRQAPPKMAALPSATAPLAAAPVVLNPMIASRAIAPPVPVAPEPFAPEFDFDGRFVVQVASFKSVVSACAVWDDLRAKYPNLFDRAETIVRPTKLDSGKAVYRLRVGAFAKRGHADAWCKAFKSEGGDCFVTKR